jgi:flavodoxin
MKTLVAYFSPTGTTAAVAERLAEAVGADIFEIEPKKHYTEEDLNWWDSESRSSKEMKDPSSRPETSRVRDNMADYDVIALGFPIWWGKAPTIVNTFLEEHDFT